MEIILLDTVPSLGHRGDTVKVTAGYARNFLLPRKLAILASDSNRHVLKEQEKVLAKRDEQAKSHALKTATKLTDFSCTIPVQVGEEDKLYGSVTSNDIAKVLKDQGFEVDKKHVALEEPIKQLGVYTVEVRLHREVSAPIKVWVVKE